MPRACANGDSEYKPDVMPALVHCTRGERMFRNNFRRLRVCLSFFLIVSVLKCPCEAVPPISQVSIVGSQVLHDAKLYWNSRPEIQENANSSSYATFLSWKSRWRGVQEDDTSWPVFTLGWRTILALILGALAASVSSAGGIGGGALYVPIFNLLLGFDSNTSAALSSFMIFGGTLVNLFWYFIQKHPQFCDKPLMDYDVALIFQPNVLLGISVGVLLNVMSPAWLVTALLIVTLSYTTFRSFGGAFRLWNAESSSKDDYTAADENGGLNSKDHLSPPFSCPDQKEEGKDELLEPLLESQSQNYPRFPAIKIAMLALIWLGFFTVQLVRGIAAAQDLWNVEECGTAYWLLTLSQLPLTCIMTACVINYFRKYSKPLEDCDIVNSKSLIALPVCALLAGLLGGMLGLGGGMLLSPILLEIGMHPQATAATSTFMVFFSSSLSVVQYWFLGRIPLAYGISSAAVSLVFSVIGLQLVQRVIYRFGRVSVILFAYSSVVGISAVLMALFGSLDVLSDIQQGAYMGFSSPC